MNNPWNPWANWYQFATTKAPSRAYKVYARGEKGLVMFEAVDMSITDAINAVKSQGFQTPLMVIK